MNCNEFTTEYLDPHVDGELSGAQVRLVEDHLAECANCRTLVSEQRSLKAALKAQVPILSAPVELRNRILRALDTEESVGDHDRESRIGSLIAGWLSPRRLWLPIGVAAAAVLAIVVLLEGPLGGPQDVPSFDLAIQSLDKLERNFTPNVPSGSRAEVAEAYRSAGIPVGLWNFEAAGLHLVGGRLDHLPDGRLVARTMYRGKAGSILCSRFDASGLVAPPGAIQTVSMSSHYRYRDCSICFTVFRDGIACVLVSRMPFAEFSRAVAMARMDQDEDGSSSE